MSFHSRSLALPQRAAIGTVPIVAALFTIPVIAMLLSRGSSLADPTVAAVRLDPDTVRRAGLEVALRHHPELPAAVLEVQGGPTAAVLAASADGARAALAERIGQDAATLVMVEPDGAQLRVPMQGLLAAAYAPDGSWLATIDGLGRMWRVDAGDGAADPIADGPFGGSVHVAPDGSLVTLAVSSVEAPFISHLVRVDPQTGELDELSSEELVYAAQPLAGGGLAVVSHRPEGTVLQRAGAAGVVVAERMLGVGAVNVSVSDDMELIAWERDGEVYLRASDGSLHGFGPGGNPRLSANGQLLLLERNASTLAYASSGGLLAESTSALVLLDCAGCGS